MRIDSHHHLWNYSPEQYDWIGDQMSILKRDYAPIALRDVTSSVGIQGVVSVQARQTLEETDWLVELANNHDLIRGVVGWVPLADPRLEESLERLQSKPKLKGVRHVVQSEEDDRFILGAEFNRGISLLPKYGLVYDILILAKHLPPTIEFVDQHPEQPFVLDHIAKPTIALSKFDVQWEKNIRELAKRKNVFCKFSGVVTEVRDERWTLATLQPYWDVVLDAFGVQRLMFGSDWPVCLLRSSYAQWHDATQHLASQLSASEQQAFWGDNATRVYQL